MLILCLSYACLMFQMIVTDVYNHRFHKVFAANEALTQILDRDDIFVLVVLFYFILFSPSLPSPTLRTFSFFLFFSVMNNHMTWRMKSQLPCLFIRERKGEASELDQ